MQEVAGIEGTVLSYALSRDGKRVAFRGDIQEPVRTYVPTNLFVCDATPRAVARNLTSSFGYDIGGGLLVGDQHPPRGVALSPPIWNAAGTAIIERVLKEGRTNLELFDAATGGARPFTTGDHEIIAMSATPDGSRLAAVVSTPTIIGDIYLAEGARAPMRRLTNLNEKLFAEVRITPPEEFWYDSFDGKKMHAFLQKPSDFDPKNKYPLILDIHGGLHAAYGFTFFHEFQWMAAKGYIVLYPNPRGSSSYGVEFANLTQYAFPGDDHKDLLTGIDELVRRGYVDPKRLGVTGGSGGGILTNWIIGHNDRFAAAVSQRSIADYAAWWYAGDGTLFHQDWFRSPPFDDPAEYVGRSPISHVRKIKTPLMLIEGESDFRTPPTTGGEMLFRALKYLKRPVVMVRFPNESHELSRSGNPWHRVERLRHIVNWFDKYLQGKPMPQYDLVPPEVKGGTSQP
jgi:dipeptidyl aminopeptidase/acylaminoacyl peptidase